MFAMEFQGFTVVSKSGFFGSSKAPQEITSILVRYARMIYPLIAKKCNASVTCRVAGK
jgi:hypothetical protein